MVGITNIAFLSEYGDSHDGKYDLQVVFQLCKFVEINSLIKNVRMQYIAPMSTKKDDRKTLKVDNDLHRDIKILSAIKGVSMIGLLAELVAKAKKEFDLEKQKDQ